MRWSIKSLMLYMLVFALCLTFCNVTYIESALILCGAIALLGFILPGKPWRYLTWGAVFGVIAAFIAASLFVRIRVVHTNPPTYASTSLEASVHDPLKRYIFPMGAFVGGSVGLLIFNARRQPDTYPGDRDV
jgi:O-antigen ligase